MQSQRFIKIKSVIVIPCYNEERYLANTCASLGFGIGEGLTPENSILILVDNNSIDSTVSIAEYIKKNSYKDTVFIGFEKEQGFVTTRHHGNMLAKSIAESKGWNIDDIFILQADADTIYSADYINIMRLKSELVGKNIIIEACSDFPSSFKSVFQSYINLCNNLDIEFCNLFPEDLSDDYIVDDKAVGYRLGDYFKWGGHRREYNCSNDEIYSETSRLYMAARTKGAQRTLVNDATILHSVRKIHKNPLLHLATAGFPREDSWNKKWVSIYGNEFDLLTISSQNKNKLVIEAILVRKLHIIGLFCILPLSVQMVLGREIKQKIPSFIDSILKLLPQRTLDDLSSKPSLFLTDIFKLIEEQKDKLLSHL